MDLNVKCFARFNLVLTLMVFYWMMNMSWAWTQMGKWVQVKIELHLWMNSLLQRQRNRTRRVRRNRTEKENINEKSICPSVYLFRSVCVNQDNLDRTDGTDEGFYPKKFCAPFFAIYLWDLDSTFMWACWSISCLLSFFDNQDNLKYTKDFRKRRIEPKIGLIILKRVCGQVCIHFKDKNSSVNWVFHWWKHNCVNKICGLSRSSSWLFLQEKTCGEAKACRNCLEDYRAMNQASVL